MARRFSQFPRSRGGSRKHSDWTGSPALTVGIAVPAASAVLTEVFTPRSGGETVIRTRGTFGWSSDSAAATEDQLGAYGIGLVSAQAVSVGITAIPHPATDASWGGWLYHSFFFSQTQFLSSIGLMFDKMHTVEIDSKAMRKVGDEERIVMVVENSGATHGISFFDSVRILSKGFS